MSEIEKEDAVVVTNPALVKFAGVQAKLTAVGEDCANLEIIDEDSEAIATKRLSEANQLEKIVENKRVELTAKPLKEQREIKAASVYILTEFNKGVAIGRENLKAYKKLEEEKMRAIQKELEDARNRLAMRNAKITKAIDAASSPEKLKVVFQQFLMIKEKEGINKFGGAETWGDINDEAQAVRSSLIKYGTAAQHALKNPEDKVAVETAKEDIKEEVRETVKDAGESVIMANTSTSNSNLRADWQFEVIDQSKLPASFLMPNEAAIKELRKQMKTEGILGTQTGDTIRHGIRFYNDQKLVVR